MEYLQMLSESEEGQTFINENQEAILEATEVFHSTPQEVKDYIGENLEQFLVPGDLKATYENMTSFVENTVVQILSNLSEQISE